MENRYLFVVEGEKAEFSIIDRLFSELGFTVNKCTTDSDLIKKELANVDKLVHVIQGPRNRIRDLLNFELEIKDFPKHYGIKEHINQCYILYDADYNSSDELSQFFDTFSDENEGILLLSNPCLEVLADTKYENHIGRSKAYKKKVKEQVEKANNLKSINLIDYICDNIGRLLIEQLDRNVIYFEERNVSYHPSLGVELAMNSNIQNFENELHEFSELFTLLYVSVAMMFNLTKEFDNYLIVRKFLDDNLM